jgi:hypothetical protein
MECLYQIEKLSATLEIQYHGMKGMKADRRESAINEHE